MNLHEIKEAAHQQLAWSAVCELLNNPSVGVHLAIMHEPFLTYLFNGRKTMESRFSVTRIAPYQKVRTHDLVLLKCGPLVGSFRVQQAHFHQLGSGDLQGIRYMYAHRIGTDSEDFWKQHEHKNYATLLTISDVQQLPPIHLPNKNRSGWLVLR